MSPRERFFAIMDFKKIDRIIDTEFGYWKDTLRRWHSEGLPSWVDNNEKADVFFGFDVWKKQIPANTNIDPVFQEEILEQNAGHTIKYDQSRVKCEVFTNGADTIPHYLDFPIKDFSTWQPFKERLKPDAPKRLHADLKALQKILQKRNYILCAGGGSTAGIIRNWMGFEGICMGIYDQPDLLDDMLAALAEVSASLAGEITAYIDVDLVAWWEDIAFKTGPIVTPSFFIDKCGPVYKKVMDIYRSKGTRFSYVDCDGDFRTLLAGWMNNGVNIMFPLEVASGIHPENLRRDHPGMRMMGGFDKMLLLQGKNEIRTELKRLKKITDEGGYIPHVDHRVQADVPYGIYLYYLECKRDLFGLTGKTPV
ncbi:MAG: hypothetical protein A2096_00055 [Spirochaetes bacterium GWF1_41_5]|nr:MAG: hypothetical protein A2096_00055 [Spirochaetes bacterium GWF1_41_5]